MSAFSNFLEGKIVDHVLRGTTYTSPGVVYLALFTADPTEAGNGPECNTSTNYPGYVRVSCGATPSSAWSEIDANGMTQNQNVITFPAVGGASPVTVTHWALFDALSSGNMLYYGAMAAPKQLDPADVASFPANTLKITHN
jgi:hypothetical protein